MKFNTATYLVLGILLREPRSGYDIVKELANFRPSKSSQIYPILARLEKHGHIACEHIQQDSRPNKKVYTVTSKGKEALSAWQETTPNPPVIRDDFLSMFFSIWIKEPDTLIKLVSERLEYMKDQLAYFQEELNNLEISSPSDIKNFYSWKHCTYYLYKRRIALTEQDILWCEELLNEHNTSS